MVRRALTGLVVLAMALVPIACSDDGDDGHSSNGNPGAVAFTAANAARMAGTFASIVDPFCRVGRSCGSLVMAAEAAAGPFAAGARPAAARDQVDLGDLGICSGGQSPATWDDRDGDGALSAGDVLRLSLADCEDVDAAALKLTLEDVGFALTTGALEVSATVTDVVDSQPVTLLITGRYRLEMNRVEQPLLLICRHVVSDQADASQYLNIARNGTTVLELGCFNLTFTHDLEGDGFTLGEPAAVFKLPGVGIMSLDPSDRPALDFPDGVTPVSGEVEFVGYSTATPCTAVGVPGDGIDSNDSYLNLSVGAGGVLTLSGRTADGATFSIQESWDEIY